MYLTQRQRLLAAIDPSVLERERQDLLEHTRRARLVGSMDAAAERVAFYARRYAADPTSYHRRALERGEHRLSYFTAAAERAGLIRPRKDLAQ